MLIKDTIPFVGKTADRPQSADSHMEPQVNSIAMPNHQQLHIPPRSSCSAGHNASIVHLLSNNKISLVVDDVNAHHS